MASELTKCKKVKDRTEIFMRDFLKKKVDPIIPLYSIIPLMSCFFINTLIYYGTMFIANGRKHYDFTTGLDRSVPVIPEFVIIYFVCYAFWAFNYILIGKISKEHCMRFVVADITSRLICAVFFILLPTTNIRPEVVGSGLSNELLRYLYTIDNPYNLFPSIHCLVSWFCFIGIRGEKKIPFWYRTFSFVFAVAVCLSTQFTKQHYLIDWLGAIIVAELTYRIAFSTRFYIYFEKFFDWISGLVFLHPGYSVKGGEGISVKKQEEHI